MTYHRKLHTSKIKLHNDTVVCVLCIYTHHTGIVNGNSGDVSVPNGSRVTLSCTLSATGTRITYLWYRTAWSSLAYWELGLPGDEPVVQDGYEMTIDKSTGFSEFNIQTVDLDDEARYFCESLYAPTPPGGNPMDSMTITVLGKYEYNTINVTLGSF